MIKKILHFIVCFFIVGTVAAQTGREAQVAVAVTSLTKAMIDADKPVLEKLTDPGLSYGHSSGKIQNQKEFIDAIVSGASDFVTIDLLDQTIRVSGKTAIVRHILSATTNDGGKPGTVKLSVLLVWQKKHGHWKLLARQAVKVA